MKHKSTTNNGELLSQGKAARAELYPCGHVMLKFEDFRIGFSKADFEDFANTVTMAQSHLACREMERSEWGLFM